MRLSVLNSFVNSIKRQAFTRQDVQTRLLTIFLRVKTGALLILRFSNVRTICLYCLQTRLEMHANNYANVAHLQGNPLRVTNTGTNQFETDRMI